MRRGERGRHWSVGEIRELESLAGEVPRREIARRLRRSNSSVRTMASRLGLSLRVARWDMRWCDGCATWRTSLGERTGHCRVCDKWRGVEAEEGRVADEIAAMTPEQRAAFDAGEGRRGRQKPRPRRPARPDTSRMPRARARREEARYMAAVEEWELEFASRRYDAAKTRLKRARWVRGTNPRGSSRPSKNSEK